MPGSTEGAASFSASSPGSAASSESQSQPVPWVYSQPRPAGGARVSIVSKRPPSASIAVALRFGWIRTRCWVVEVPVRSA